jgi:hypothetical protein
LGGNRLRLNDRCRGSSLGPGRPLVRQDLGSDNSRHRLRIHRRQLVPGGGLCLHPRRGFGLGHRGRLGGKGLRLSDRGGGSCLRAGHPLVRGHLSPDNGLHRLRIQRVNLFPSGSLRLHTGVRLGLGHQLGSDLLKTGPPVSQDLGSDNRFHRLRIHRRQLLTSGSLKCHPGRNLGLGHRRRLGRKRLRLSDRRGGSHLSSGGQRLRLNDRCRGSSLGPDNGLHGCGIGRRQFLLSSSLCLGPCRGLGLSRCLGGDQFGTQLLARRRVLSRPVFRSLRL